MEREKRILWKNLGYILVCLLAAIAGGTVLLTAVYALPVDKMKENVWKNVQYYDADHYVNCWAPGYFNTYLDIYTDSLMQNTAVFQGSGSCLRNAMTNMNVVSIWQADDPLYAALYYDGGEDADVKQYARYWHGYLVFLKPLLLLTDMSGIRMLNMFFQSALTFAVLLVLYKAAGMRGVIPFGLAIICINPVSTILCMQYSAVYYITLISALWMLKSGRYQGGRYWIVFLWIGISTAFFDLLTYPLAGLGMNLILLIILQNSGLKDNFKRVIASTAAWLAGYAGMWAGKWLTAFLVTGQNVFRDAMLSVSERIQGDTSAMSDIDPSDFFGVIRINLGQYRNFPVKVILILLFMVLAYLVIFKRYRFLPKASLIPPLFLISLYPIVWYCVLRNHSIIHFWFSHRNLVVTFMGISSMIAFSLDKKE